MSRLFTVSRHSSDLHFQRTSDFYLAFYTSKSVQSGVKMWIFFGLGCILILAGLSSRHDLFTFLILLFFHRFFGSVSSVMIDTDQESERELGLLASRQETGGEWSTAKAFLCMAEFSL